ncbi:hypothetical protein CDL15_Pgr022753 [Punica granatum]|uniref:Uncharacterized protein n=1 Tax=Punica granatum TaxID=22663 RepID=A0A218XS46_PUNGR|nr:hypothetical protein CDL15_Pgr022753 [Punica granatum]
MDQGHRKGYWGRLPCHRTRGWLTINHRELLVIEERIIEVRLGFPRINGSHHHSAEAILAVHLLSQKEALAGPGRSVAEYLLQVTAPLEKQLRNAHKCKDHRNPPRSKLEVLKAFCSSPQPSNGQVLDAPDGSTPPDSLRHFDNRHRDQAVDAASEDPSLVPLRHVLADARGGGRNLPQRQSHA